MSQERHIIIQAGRFDGTTLLPTSGAGWTAGPGNVKFSRYSTTGVVGRFPPAALGRSPYKHSMVKIYVDGPLVQGDGVTVVGSANVSLASPINPVRRPLTLLTTSPETATAIELGPDDDPCVVFEGDDASPSTVHIVIWDLDEEQLEALALTRMQALLSGFTPTIEQRDVAVTAVGVTLDTWATDVLYVDALSADPNGLLRLPLIGGIKLGARVRITRQPGVDWFRVIGSNNEPVNGSTDPVRFIAEQVSAWLERTVDGWVSTLAPDNVEPLSANGNHNLSIPPARTTYVRWGVDSDQELTLPPIADVAIDQEFFVLATVTGRGGDLAPAPGEAINGVVGRRIPFGATGDVAYARRVPLGWLVLWSGRVSRATHAVVADPGLGGSGGWQGMRLFNCTYAANGNFTLPTAPMDGTEVIVNAVGASVVTLNAGPNVIKIAGTSAATWALTANTPARLIFSGGLWYGVQ